ncbi:hypothetical protein NQ315_014477 [Exocentrus adspersus]|uniref:Tyr recombinase domain-containing protein n=1 Tax=Exocentrus adspersus TaxID=1586481 RepID=A0AAV8VEH0_9CUCU|nr:hypothetical protein NQ315_014477 [Exocentrus adspersus]
MLAYFQDMVQFVKNRKSRDDVKFLKSAPDEEHLLHKVILIMGYFGDCRGQKLLNMKIYHIKDRDSVMVVDIPESKKDICKKFTIVEENEFSALGLVRKYLPICLCGSGSERYFLTYREKSCTVQPVGKNTFGKMPSKIANFLGLPDPEAFTGHCLRRTSATALVNAGANMTTLKRHGRWRSSTVAEGYLADSMEYVHLVKTSSEPFLLSQVRELDLNNGGCVWCLARKI